MAKKELEDSYLDAEVDYISGKISDLTKHHISKKHHLAWKTVKDLAGKNATSTVRLKGGSAKKRLENLVQALPIPSWKRSQVARELHTA